MRTCPWCGRRNLNVYAYCQSCGRGFDGPAPTTHLPGFWTENLTAWLAPDQHAGSPWPLFAGILGLLFSILLAWHVSVDSSITMPLTVAAGAASLVVILAWSVSSALAGKETAPVAPASLVERTFIVDSWADPRDVRHALRRVPGVRSVACQASEGRAAVIVVHEPGITEAGLLQVLHGLIDPGVPPVSFEAVELPPPAAPRLRMGIAAAATGLGGLVLAGLAAAGAFAAFSSGDSGGPAVTPSLPGMGVTTIVAKDILFDHEVIRVSPAETVTLTLDNQDAGVPHNIEFFNSPTPGEGGFLQGCSDGCIGDGSVATEIQAGPAVQEFTFTAPAAGRYGYWCVVHPTTMTGVLIAE